MRLVRTTLLITFLLAGALPGAELVLPVDDFRDGDIEAASGLSWIVLGDDMLGGASEAVLAVVPFGADESAGALRLEGEVREGFAMPFVSVWAPLSPAGRPVDLSTYEGLRFRIRGSGPVVQAGLRRSAGTNFMAPVATDSEWKAIEIPFDQLELVGPPQQSAEWSPSDVAWLGFSTAPGFTGRFAVEIDSIEIYGDPPPQTPVVKIEPLRPSQISSLDWRHLAAEDEPDANGSHLPDARRLEVASDPRSGRVWFRVELGDALPAHSIGINIAVDSDGDPDNGMSWWGSNSDFKFDRLVSAYLNRGASYWQGWVGVTDSDAVGAGGFDSISSDVLVLLDRESNALAVGVPRPTLGSDRLRLISTVGSALLNSDDLPDSGAVELDLRR